LPASPMPASCRSISAPPSSAIWIESFSAMAIPS
jgi:hypothetical protein